MFARNECMNSVNFFNGLLTLDQVDGVRAGRDHHIMQENVSILFCTLFKLRINVCVYVV